MIQYRRGGTTYAIYLYRSISDLNGDHVSSMFRLTLRKNGTLFYAGLTTNLSHGYASHLRVSIASETYAVMVYSKKQSTYTALRSSSGLGSHSWSAPANMVRNSGSLSYSLSGAWTGGQGGGGGGGGASVNALFAADSSCASGGGGNSGTPASRNPGRSSSYSSFGAGDRFTIEIGSVGAAGAGGSGGYGHSTDASERNAVAQNGARGSYPTLAGSTSIKKNGYVLDSVLPSSETSNYPGGRGYSITNGVYYSVAGSGGPGSGGGRGGSTYAGHWRTVRGGSGGPSITTSDSGFRGSSLFATGGGGGNGGSARSTNEYDNSYAFAGDRGGEGEDPHFLYDRGEASMTIQYWVRGE